MCVRIKVVTFTTLILQRKRKGREMEKRALATLDALLLSTNEDVRLEAAKEILAQYRHNIEHPKVMRGERSASDKEADEALRHLFERTYLANGEFKRQVNEGIEKLHEAGRHGTEIIERLKTATDSIRKRLDDNDNNNSKGEK